LAVAASSSAYGVSSMTFVARSTCARVAMCGAIRKTISAHRASLDRRASDAD